MYYLHRYKIICCLIGICFINQIFAQRVLNLEDHDAKPYYFGISLSYVRNQLHIAKNLDFFNQGTVQVVDPIATNGFGFGLHATARLSDHFELRFNPQLIIGSSYSATYITKDQVTNVITEQKLSLPTLISSFPLQVKFMSDRIGNFKFYALGGVKYDMDLTKIDNTKSNPFVLDKKTYGFEIGAGCSFYLKYVIVSPEIKLSYMLNNILSKDSKTSVIGSARPYFTFFTLHFEG